MKPLGWLGSILLFGIPSLVGTAFLFLLMPAVVASGASKFAGFLAGFIAPLALMLIAALAAYRMEAGTFTWAGLRDRFRLHALDRRGWLWTGVLVLWMVGNLSIFPINGAIQHAFANVKFYDPPVGYSSFMNSLTDGQTQIFGLPFSWSLLVYYLFCLFVFNILGEELWWRGYILPRQELAFGASAWLVNGLLWACFHAFYHFNLGIFLSFLPTTIPLAFVAQRTRSTWPGIIAHFVMNLEIPILMMSRLLTG
jgi:membrane protease YdiL (CAAX protease family)